MTFKPKAVAALILGTAFYATSSLAAYGPAPAPTAASAWDISVGYGQTFGHKETDWSLDSTTGTTASAAVAASPIIIPSGKLKLDDLKIIEADIFHKSNFGVVYMGTAEDGAILLDGENEGDSYTFQALMAGYRFTFANNLTARIAGGMSKQEVKLAIGPGLTAKKDDGFAANANIRYNFPLSSGFNIFGEVGYLMQDKVTEDDLTIVVPGFSATLDPNAGYWKVGVSFGM